MAALHDALKTLGPIDFSETPIEDLKPFLTGCFKAGELIVDSVPISAPAGDAVTSEGRDRSNTASSTASSASEISLSSARSAPPPADVEALQKEWKQVKLGAKENPLGMSVYKLGGKDGKGSWFARRSVHEGLGFTKWKRGLEREFPETMKVQGSPGEGNIRGIGGESRVAYKTVPGLGKLEGRMSIRSQLSAVLTASSISSDSTVSGPYYTKRLRHHAYYLRPSSIRTIWRRKGSTKTFHGDIKAVYASRYSASRRIYTWPIRIRGVYQGDTNQERTYKVGIYHKSEYPGPSCKEQFRLPSG